MRISPKTHQLIINCISSGSVDVKREGRRLVPQQGITQWVPDSGHLIDEPGIAHIFHCGASHMPSDEWE